MKVAILSFPGSYDFAHTKRVLTDQIGVEAEEFSHEIDSLQRLSQYEMVVVPGGASFSDAVFPGRLVRGAKVGPALRKYAETDNRILGIGNGFQILCELGILPGTLLKNRNCAYLNGRFAITAANRDSSFMQGLPADKTYSLPVTCYHGRYYADRRTIQEVEEKSQIAFQYVTRFGEPDVDNTRHGALNGVAGVLNRKKNVLGVIFHPERAADPEIGVTDGLDLLKSFCKGADA